MLIHTKYAAGNIYASPIYKSEVKVSVLYYIGVMLN